MVYMKIERLEPSKTCLMVVDMQHDFASEGFPLYCEMGRKMVPKLVEFTAKCRELGIQVIYTRTLFRPDGKDMGNVMDACAQITEQSALIEGNRGSEFIDELEILPEDIVIKKRRYSAFYGTHLETLISSMGIENMLITGLCTEACCFSTARDAQMRNMKVGFIADLTGNMDFEDLGWGSMTAEEMHRAMLINIALTTADVMNSEDALKLIK